MKKIQTPNFIAKNSQEYSFNLEIDNQPDDDSVYYIVNVYDNEENKVGSITLANITEEKYKSLYSGKYGNIKLLEERNITETGLEITEEGLKIIDREIYNDFIENTLFLENLDLNTNEREMLSEIRNFIKPEKELLKTKFNKPEILSVYVDNGYEDSQDLRGLGIGKKLYEYASQWMGANDMKVYTQNIRTQNAIDIWKAFKKDSQYNYGKDELGEFIVRYDGIEQNNEIEDILKSKILEISPKSKSRYTR